MPGVAEARRCQHQRRWPWPRRLFEDPPRDYYKLMELIGQLAEYENFHKVPMAADRRSGGCDHRGLRGPESQGVERSA